jgi:ABC-type nitrate/sulfonate/bicarbonate transport system permease component
MTAFDASPRAARAARRSQRSSSTPLRGLLPLLLLLVAWQLLGRADSPYFPPPSEWLAALRPLMTGNALLIAIAWTSLTFVLGLALAILIGAAVGALVGSNRGVDRATGPTFEFLRVLPAAALVPLAALLLGYTMKMKLVIVVLVTVWPILLSCRSARKSLSPVLLDVGRTLGLSRKDRIRKMLIPTLTPSVLLGARVAAPLALIITILVEIVTTVNGLGMLLAMAQAQFNSAQVYGLLVVAGVLGFLVNEAVTRGEAATRRRMTGRAG